MPIDYKKYPENWKEIREKVLERDKYCCKHCGVSQYAIGYRNEEKEFVRACGNIFFDDLGFGMFEGRRLKAKEGNSFKKQINEWSDEKYIMIVLTIAHLDHDINNNKMDNLAALCQRCHLVYDNDFHIENRKKKKKKNQIEMKF
jgi:hypothetical protein